MKLVYPCDMVALNMDTYAEKYGSRAAKKTLTIPT